MAYVVARRNSRFELRESVHTPRGPRARTLAGFGVLSDEVLARGAARATRPFDAVAVVDSGRRAGAQVTAATFDARTRSAARTASAAAGPAGSFLEASRRMARSVRRDPATERMSPGDALIDLLGFADAVRASQAPRQAKPLAFPVIGRLTAQAVRRGLAHT